MNGLTQLAGGGVLLLTFLGLLYKGFIQPTARVVRAIGDTVEQVRHTARAQRQLTRWLARYVDATERRLVELEQHRHPAAGRRSTPRPRTPLVVVPPIPPELLEENTPDAQPS